MTLREAIKKKKDEIFKLHADTVIQGVPTYEEYRYQLGILYGLEKLMQEIEPLLRAPDDALFGEDLDADV